MAHIGWKTCLLVHQRPRVHKIDVYSVDYSIIGNRVAKFSNQINLKIWSSDVDVDFEATDSESAIVDSESVASK